MNRYGDDPHAPNWQPLDVSCPECRESFFVAQYIGINLYGCGSCGSAWLDNDGCRRLVAALIPEGVIETVHAMDKMEKTEVKEAGYRVASRGYGAPRTCPWCAIELGPNTIGGVEIDACQAHGTFFDKRELVTLSRAMSMKAFEGDALLRDFRTIALATDPSWLRKPE